MTALKGKRQNACDTNPCYHGGRCTQTFQDRTGYKCRCSGTGYYGKKCQFSVSYNLRELVELPL
ncbi:delta-like protein B [Diaphorina citri]|uniref:Delta-like protein B n=1 Tax=Diaphorina citri TaxID=121845 RepID=A0A3Q0JDZ6_DIACI|nr:delta-like protein B [Diaphorina citri]